jgi:hypothetical protein
MSNYTESTVTGHAWRRCNQIVIDNRRSATPTVRFDEETVVALDGAAEVRAPAGVLTIDFDPSREIPLRDPQTGEPTGAVMTYAEAYAVLYSAYLDAALERDVQRAESTFDSEGAV